MLFFLRVTQILFNLILFCVFEKFIVKDEDESLLRITYNRALYDQRFKLSTLISGLTLSDSTNNSIAIALKILDKRDIDLESIKSNILSSIYTLKLVNIAEYSTEKLLPELKKSLKP